MLLTTLCQLVKFILLCEDSEVSERDIETNDHGVS